MEDVPGPPVPPDRNDDRPNGAGPTPEIADVRDRFARVTKESGSQDEGVPEFLEHKIEMIRTDPNLSDADKEAAIAEIRARSDRTDTRKPD